MTYEDVVKFIYVLARFLNSYVATVVCVLGIILNLFSIYVFRMGDKGRTIPAIHYYLATLLLWESGVLATILLHALPVFIWERPLPFPGYFPLYIGNIYLTISTSTAVVWVLVALTVDRYLALCYPMKHRTYGTRSKAKKTMIIISIAALLFAIPELFETTVGEKCGTNSKNETICLTSPEHTDLAKNNVYWAIYRVFLSFTFVSVGPCLLLCLLTVKITLALKREFKERRQLLAQNAWNNRNDAGIRKTESFVFSKELKANLLLVVIIAKSTICSVQPTLGAFLRLVIGEAGFRGPFIGIWYYLNDFITELDYASNFFVFIIFGTMFRRTCKRIITSSFVGRLFGMRTVETTTGLNLSGKSNTTQVSEKYSTQSTTSELP